MASTIISPTINLQTFNTTTKGGDAMASIDHNAPNGHDTDSSSVAIKVTRTVSSPDEHAGLIRIVFPEEDEMIVRCLSGTYPRLTKIPHGGLTLTGGALTLTRVDAGGSPMSLSIYELKEDFSENEITHNSPVGNGTADWTPLFSASTKVYQNSTGYKNIEPQHTVGTASYNNDPTITHATSSTIKIGQYVTGSGIPTDATVASITDTTHFELSVATTGGSKTGQTLTFKSAPADYSLNALIKLNKLNFGDRVLLYLMTSQGTTEHLIDTPSTAYSNPYYKLTFTCEPPVPKITVVPDANGTDGIINVETPQGDAFIADGQYYAAWNDSATITYNQSGKTSTFTDTNLSTIATNSITGALLDADGTDYYMQVFAEDGLQLLSNAGKSNVVYVKRPECSAALTNAAGGSDYAPEVGEEMTLTVTPANGMFSGRVKEFGVNWDSGTSDLDSDYSWYVLDTPASAAYVIKHRFHKIATFQIKVRVKDELGWSSDNTATATANTVVDEPTPIANLSLSREKVLQAKFLDRTTVLTASLSKSKAIGSNRELTHYWFRYVPAISTTVCTSGAINNDNSAFDNHSGRVSLQVIDKTNDYSETSFQIYGQASFTAAGGPILDSDPTFDHYKYVTEKLFVPTTRLTEGDAKAAEVAETAKGVSFYFYKSVEIAVCTAVDAQDSGTSFFTRYILKKYATDDTAATVINASLRPVAKTGNSNFENLYSWGGFARAATGSGTFVASGNYIQSGTDDWYDHGFLEGDIIKVKDGNGTNGSYAAPKYFKIKSFAASSGSGVGATYNRAVIETDATLLTSHEKSYLTTSIADSSSATSEIVLDNSDVPAVTFSVYNSTGADDSVTVYGAVADSDESFFVLNDSAEVSQTFRAVVPNTLDLDELVDDSDVALLSSNISRSGGMSAQMPLGQRKYPVGVVRTKAGMPKLSLSVRVLSQTGLSAMWNLIEGDVYDFCFLDSDKIDTPTVAFKSYKLKAEGGTLTRDPSSATQYIANIEFTILGEELQVA